MTKIKNSIFNMLFAASLLFAGGVANFSIIKVVKEFTGWKMPRWLAGTLAAVGVASSVVAILGSFGVSIPISAAKIIACLGGATA